MPYQLHIIMGDLNESSNLKEKLFAYKENLLDMSRSINLLTLMV